MSTKQQPSELPPTRLEERTRPQEEPKSCQKEEAVEGVWEKLPEVLRKQVALQLAKVLHQVISQPVKREVGDE